MINVSLYRLRPLILGTGLITLTLAFSACNFREDKVDADQTPATITTADLNYANVNSKVLTPYCLGCHSAAGGNRGGINLETFSAVTRQIDSVKASAIDERSMPPTTASLLPSSAYELLKQWIEAGAPQ